MEEETQELEPQPEETDWFLAALVKIANKGAQMGITLQFGGVLVSGTLVGGAEYFEGFAQEFASMFPDGGGEDMRQSIAQAAEPYKSARAVDLDLPVEFVHLKDARFFTTPGPPIPSNRGVWWRGRLSEVGGFVLGSIRSDG